MRRHDIEPSMRVLYVSQSFKRSHALGAKIRRSGFEAAFARSSLILEHATLRRRERTVAEVFSAVRPESSPANAVFRLASQSDAVFLEGLPVGVATIAAIRRRKRSGKIHVDICDSWVRLAGAGSGEGSSLRAKTARRFKTIIAAVALRYVSKYADSVSYISVGDLEADERHLSHSTKRLVVPNGSPVQTSSSLAAWSRNGPMVVVGDWAYPPNQTMLHTLFEWYPTIEGHTKTAGLNVIGPNLSTPVPSVNDITVVGWVDDISSAYSNVSCALALTSSGGGVKNKVLEPLSLGIPVIATREALKGIAYDPSMVLVFDDGLTADDVTAWLDGQESLGRRSLTSPSWDECVSDLISYITDGEGS